MRVMNVFIAVTVTLLFDCHAKCWLLLDGRCKFSMENFYKYIEPPPVVDQRQIGLIRKEDNFVLIKFQRKELCNKAIVAIS